MRLEVQDAAHRAMKRSPCERWLLELRVAPQAFSAGPCSAADLFPAAAPLADVASNQWCLVRDGAAVKLDAARPWGAAVAAAARHATQ
eukprot:3682548-Prymnesium_polylepis.1